MISIGINGASGRMGQEIINLINSDSEYSLDFAKSQTLIQSVSCSMHNYPSISNSDVIIDFSSPESCLETISWCISNSKPLVIGTTGFSSDQIDFIRDASKQIAIVYSPNMSLSVNVLFGISKMVAKYLPDAEVEIIESHHRHKKDSPSGTAIRIGQAIADGRQVDFDQVANYTRERIVTESRKKEEIGFAVIRGGDIVGKHTASFILDGEELNLTSEITNRKSFAAGALLASKFLVGKKSGYFTMFDVLGLNI